MNPVLSAVLRWIVTALIVTAAMVVAIALWRRYETEPWTRDGRRGRRFGCDGGGVEWGLPGRWSCRFA